MWVLGQCHVTSVCCETRVGGSRDGLTLPFFVCVFGIQVPPSRREGGGEEREGGREEREAGHPVCG